MYITTRHIILFTVLAILTLLLFIGGPDYDSSRSFKAFWNLGHILYYALMCKAIFSLSSQKQLSVRFHISLILLATLLMGSLVELLQAGLNRTPDTGDLFRNMIGAALGVAFLLPGRKTIPGGILRPLQAITIILVASQIYPVATALTDEYQARSQFPSLADFENPYELQRWTGSASRAIEDCIVLSGKYAMRVSLDTAIYSGVSLSYFPSDWTGFSHFQYSIFNPTASPLTITCRIHDLAHIQRFEDRYNQSFVIVHGWNTISIDLSEVETAPAKRDMDMGHIHGIGIFATRLTRPRVIYIDRVRLVR